jgi:uncharacterized repeat protein (TIGR02543 family)
MGTRRHAFASMGRKAAALAACMALVAGLSPYAPARADEAAQQAPAAQDTPAPAAVAVSGAAAQEAPATAAAKTASSASATASSAASESPASASQPTTLTAQSLTAQASVDDVFTGKITVGGSQFDCRYKVLSLPEGTNPGTVQVGNGGNAAIDPFASGTLAIPEKVQYGGESYAVIKLGDWCFMDCNNLTSTGLAGNTSVTSLGDACYVNCTSLTDTGLAGNSTVTAAGRNCFRDCTSLVDAALGSGLTSAPVNPFLGCTALRTVFFAGASSSAKGIELPHGVDCYHLASDATWTGVTAAQVSSNCTSLKALSQLAVSGGTYSGSPSNPWKSAIAGETLWAEGETVSVTASQPKTGYKVGWTSSDKGGSFVDAAAQSTTYTFGPSADSGTTALTAATPISYKVSFGANGGTGTMADEDMAYDAEAALTPNSLTRAGYHFAGWNTAKDGKGTSYADKASVSNLTATDGKVVTLYAQWAEDDPVTISYATADAAMGTVSPASEQVAPATGEAAGSTATPAAGYHFVNWTKGNVEVSTAATLVPAKVGDLNVAATYTANFAGNAYTIKFDANGGGGTMDPEDMAYGVEAALTANSLARANWSFAGWNTAADGSGTAYADGASVSNLTATDGGTFTLYAQWKPAQVQTRTFSIDGAEVTAILTGSSKSIDGLVVARRASASDAVAGALGGRVLQGDWDVYFTDGTTEGFGTLTLAFPATGGTVQVWEVHSGALTKGADQAVSGCTASATVTTLSEFAVTSAADAGSTSAAATAATSATTSTSTATPRTGDDTALSALLLAAAGAALAALAAGWRRRAGSRR